jgi:predicted RNA binding protein YcfA (HicA-like mRNA interferase family)
MRRRSSAFTSFSFACNRLRTVWEVIQRLNQDGWYEVAHRGSHKPFKHPVKPGRVTVPHPVRDIPIGTLRSIEKQAGIRLR